jgi:hypothetical protein
LVLPLAEADAIDVCYGWKTLIDKKGNKQQRSVSSNKLTDPADEEGELFECGRSADVNASRG